MGAPVLVGIDWGTTSARARLFTADGAIAGESAAAVGVQKVGPRTFPEALAELLLPLDVRPGSLPILASGMIGSRQGWREAPYVDCPATPAALARKAVRVDDGGWSLVIVPGVCRGATVGIPDVMRGEETQILGLDPESTPLVLPGTHSKWVSTEGETIVGFSTFMTGELWSVLLEHSLLGRLVRPGPADPGAFGCGVTASQGAAEGGALLHGIFSARTLALFDRLDGASVAEYLSGLLIGYEIGAAAHYWAAGSAPVRIVGEASLSARYRAALAAFGREAVIADAATTARGQWRVALALGLVR